MNITKSHTAFAGAALAALAMFAMTFSPARAATEKSEKTPFQQTVQGSDCNYTLYCVLTFAPTTAQTAIHSVSCWAVVSAGAVVQQLSLYFTNLNGQSQNVVLPVFSQGPNGPGLMTGSNLETLLFADTGVSPSIFLQLDSGSLAGLSCTISGWTLG